MDNCLLSSHLHSSYQLLHKLRGLSRSTISKGNYPFSLDVTALYTSVPTHEAIRSTITRLEHKNFSYYGLSTNHIEKLLTCVLSNRTFLFNNVLYEQVSGLAMGSRLSGILSTLVMDDLERHTITADLSINLYYRYVDDIFIITTSAYKADQIFQKFNAAHPTLKFEMERSSNHSLSLLDFTVDLSGDNVKTEFYRKEARKNVFLHNRSAVPRAQKLSVIRNEAERIETRCSTESCKEKSVSQFQTELNERGYNQPFVEEALSRQPSTHKQTQPNHWLWFPFFGDRIERSIKKAIKRSCFEIGICRKNNTLRAALSKKPKPVCASSCGVPNCHRLNTVYAYKCTCGAQYYGSSKRSLHVRADEHKTGKKGPTAISTHCGSCPTGQHGPTTLHDKGRDIVDTRLREAIHIIEDKPSLNKKDELIQWIERSQF